MTPILADVALFSPQHLWVLFGCFSIGAWYLLDAREAEEKEKQKMTRLLALLLLWSYPATFFMRYVMDPVTPWQDRLPLHMCSIMPYVAAGALLTRCPFMSALTYFMGTLVCIQALLTPALNSEFPHPLFFEFFVTHALIVLAALYLPLVQNWRPRPHDYLKAFLFGFAYMIAMLIVNPLLGTNYGFVMQAPAGGSILDLFGPWPWYLLGLLIPAFIAMWLLTLPFRRRDAHRQPAP